jgi:hypothetical protein
MINEWWTGRYFQGSGRGQIEVSTLREWEK